jgi:hypothetical protein
MPIDPPDKVVIVIDGDLPIGLAMNTVAALSLTVGRMVDGILGDDVKDLDGCVHTGITKVPVPILRSDAEALKGIAAKAAALPALFVVDFTDTAQSARSYDDYTAQLGTIANADLRYVGIAVAGGKKDVNKLVGSLPLYR